MSQSIPSVTTSPPGQSRGILPKNHAGERGIGHINRPGAGFDRGWEVAKISQHTGLIPTQNHFFGIHAEYESEFAFSFKNSEVYSNVL